MAKELPVQRIKELLRYDEETGNLYWKTSGSGRLGIDTKAGYLRKSGYVVIGIEGSVYAAHRVVYALAYSQSIVGCVDHIDGNTSNNRLSNLREVSASVNQQNNKARGTCLDRGRWRASIRKNYKRTYLGYFDTEEAAHQAYLEAKKIYHPEARRN
jgi:hypothetical protein